MAPREPRPAATNHQLLSPQRDHCAGCATALWVAYHGLRTITTLEGVWQLRLRVRRCNNEACPLYHLPYRSEEEGVWALPHGEFGLEMS